MAGDMTGRAEHNLEALQGWMADEHPNRSGEYGSRNIDDEKESDTVRCIPRIARSSDNRGKYVDRTKGQHNEA